MRSLILIAVVIGLVCADPASAQCSNNAPVDGNEAIESADPSFALDLLANATDEDGDALTLAVTATTCSGTVTVSQGLVLVNRPAAFTQDCTIAYKVTDQGGLSDSSTATIRFPADIFSDGFELGNTTAWTSP